MDGLAQGRVRTRTKKRLEALVQLVEDLQTLYPPQVEEPEDQPTRRSQPARVRDLAVSVTPLGGGTEIGGSAVLVEAGGVHLCRWAG